MWIKFNNSHCCSPRWTVEGAWTKTTT